MLHQNYTPKLDQNAIKSYNEWLDNQAITEKKLDEMYQAYREDRHNGNIYKLSYQYSTNHQPSRYTEALEQLKEQHEYNIYPKIEYQFKMCFSPVLFKDERHGYSRKAVAIARTNYSNAFNEYLQTVTPAVTVISNNGHHRKRLVKFILSTLMAHRTSAPVLMLNSGDRNSKKRNN